MSTFLVVGDFMVDRYLLASAERWSAEAPIPIWRIEEEFERSGGAANVAENLTALGAHVYCVASMPYPIKNRIIVNGAQVARFDQDDRTFEPDLRRLEVWANSDDIDAILVADYAKGAITTNVIDIVVGTGKPLFVDSKRSPEWWEGAKDVWFFPNLVEFEQFEAAYRRASQVILKRSAHGIARLSKGHTTECYPSFVLPTELIDVNGAGDTVMASFAYALFNQNTLHVSPLKFANAAAACVCQKPFTSTTSVDEILSTIERVNAQTPPFPSGYSESC